MLSLVITGFEAEPSRITEILALQPTHTHRQGEISERTGRAYEKSEWCLAIDKRITDYEDHSHLMDSLIATLSSRSAHFKAMRSEIFPDDVTVYGGYYYDADGQNGIGLTVFQMSVLADCQVAWGVDLFPR